MSNSQRLNMDNVSRLMAMYDEDGPYRSDTHAPWPAAAMNDHCTPTRVVTHLAPPRPSLGSGTIDRAELKELLQDLYDAHPHSHPHPDPRPQPLSKPYPHPYLHPRATYTCALVALALACVGSEGAHAYGCRHQPCTEVEVERWFAKMDHDNR